MSQLWGMQRDFSDELPERDARCPVHLGAGSGAFRGSRAALVFFFGKGTPLPPRQKRTDFGFLLGFLWMPKKKKRPLKKTDPNAPLALLPRMPRIIQCNLYWLRLAGPGDLSPLVSSVQNKPALIQLTSFILAKSYG